MNEGYRVIKNILDRPTLSRLPKTIPVITARSTQDLVQDLGFRSVNAAGPKIDVNEVELTLREYSGVNGIQQLAKAATWIG